MTRQFKLRPDERKKDEPKFSDFLSSTRLMEHKPLDVDYKDKLPPIWNQLNYGACQSFAINSIECALFGVKFEPSHFFSYWNVRDDEGTVNEDSGGTLSGTIDTEKKNGICDSILWAYLKEHFLPKPPQICYDQADKLGYKIIQAHRAETVDELRAALAMGFTPYIGLKVFENFESQQAMETGRIPMPSGEPIGGHALVISAGKDNMEPSCKAAAFITSVFIKRSAGDFGIRNSWGTGIGVNGTGYFKISYEVIERLLMDAWIITK